MSSPQGEGTMYRGKRGVWPGTPPLHLIQPGDQTAQQLQTQHSWPRPTHPAPISGGREMGAGEWRSGHVGWSISTHTLQAPPFSRDSQGRAPALHVSQCVSPCVWRFAEEGPTHLIHFFFNTRNCHKNLTFLTINVLTEKKINLSKH